MQPFITVDNGNLKNMSLMDLTRAMLGTSDSYLTSTQQAFREVPWIYRAALLRAQTVSSVPFQIEDKESGEPLEDDARLEPIEHWMRTTLYLTELSRTLYGASYHLIESNPFGYNSRPRHIPTPAVVVDWDDVKAEITSFTISMSGIGKPVDPKRMVWSWVPNPFSERLPGDAPALVALKAAGMLSAIDDMGTKYFKNGAVPITAVSVPPTMNKDDREKLENWFSRFATGVRSMFKFLPVNKDTVFTQIGSNIADSQATELTTAQRENVAVALGVPPTVIDGKSANYATANSEMMGFYLHTVIPECQQIAEHFNATLFRRYGLSFEFEPERLEVMQTAQLEQAKTLSELAGGKAIMTVDEAREWLDLEPMTPEQYDAANPKPQMPPAFGQQQPPQAGSAPAPEDIPEADAPDPEQMKAWRDAALVAVKGGSPATVGTPFDGELAAASSGRMVRDVFERHWPKETETDDWRKTAIKELARFNALAEGALSNG